MFGRIVFWLIPILIHGTVSLSITVPATAPPWDVAINPSYSYSLAYSVSLTLMAIVPIPPGVAEIEFGPVSGTVVLIPSDTPKDADGGPANTPTSALSQYTFPSAFLTGLPSWGQAYTGSLLGAFVDDVGRLVSAPVYAGTGGRWFRVPAGATRIQLGSNDCVNWSDNTGFFSVPMTFFYAPFIVNTLVPGTSYPWWSSLNSGYWYTQVDSAPENGPIILAVPAGASEVQITFLSGTMRWDSAGSDVDPNGAPAALSQYNSNDQGIYPPSLRVPVLPAWGDIFYGSLLAGFANVNGALVSAPVYVGSLAPRIPIFPGASVLQLGVNDVLVSDNTGGFNVAVSWFTPLIPVACSCLSGFLCRADGVCVLLDVATTTSSVALSTSARVGTTTSNTLATSSLGVVASTTRNSLSTTSANSMSLLTLSSASSLSGASSTSTMASATTQVYTGCVCPPTVPSSCQMHGSCYTGATATLNGTVLVISPLVADANTTVESGSSITLVVGLVRSSIQAPTILVGKNVTFRVCLEPTIDNTNASTVIRILDATSILTVQTLPTVLVERAMSCTDLSSARTPLEKCQHSEEVTSRSLSVVLTSRCSSASSEWRVIAGASIGGAVLLILLIGVLLWMIRTGRIKCGQRLVKSMDYLRELHILGTAGKENRSYRGSRHHWQENISVSG